MANIKSAKKRVKQEKRRHAVNVTRRSALKTAVKKVHAALETGAVSDVIKSLWRAAESQLARAKRKVLHPRAASRKVSRLAKRVAVYLRSSQK